MKNCVFLKSVFESKNLISDGKVNVVFAGRSNVGKSSIINAIFNNKTLAKTSSTQGKTKSINYFLVDDRFYFVDIPGYGFSKASKNNENIWEDLIESYLLSNTKKLIVLLLDIRINPTEKDKQMLSFLNFYNLPYLLVATKSDKIKKSEINNKVFNIASILNVGPKNVVYVSSEKNININLLKEKIKKWVSENE